MLDRGSFMAELGSQAIQAHQLETNEIHNDSTTVTLYGAYENHEE